MGWQKGGAWLVSILVSFAIIALVGIYELQGGWSNKPTNSGYAADINQAKEIQIQADFKAIQSALDNYQVSKGRYPENLNKLVQAGLLSSLNKNPHTGTDYSFNSDGKTYSLSTKLGDGRDYQITN